MCFLKARPSLRRNHGRKPRRMAIKTWEGFLELGMVQGYLGFYLVDHGMLFAYTPCITCSLLGYTYIRILYTFVYIYFQYPTAATYDMHLHHLHFLLDIFPDIRVSQGETPGK